MEIKEKIKEVIAGVLKVRAEEIKDDAKLYEGIGVDSTEMVEVVISLEKAFNTKFSPKEITKFSTLSEIEKAIQSRL
ncbi:MAG: acyl carrier protein [Candidatus Omnitrophota bacterium]